MLWSYGMQITPYVCAAYAGSIRVSLPHSRRKAMRVAWKGMDADAVIDRDALYVTNLKPGRYTAHVTDESTGEHKKLEAQVPRVDAAVITAYDTRSCTMFPWNGEVAARVENCPAGTRYLWSNGVVTKESRLTCARHGRYTVTLLNSALTVINATAPAVVEGVM